MRTPLPPKVLSRVSKTVCEGLSRASSITSQAFLGTRNLIITLHSTKKTRTNLTSKQVTFWPHILAPWAATFGPGTATLRESLSLSLVLPYPSLTLCAVAVVVVVAVGVGLDARASASSSFNHSQGEGYQDRQERRREEKKKDRRGKNAQN